MVIEMSSWRESEAPRLSTMVYAPCDAYVCAIDFELWLCAHDEPPSLCVECCVPSPHEMSYPVHDDGKSNWSVNVSGSFGADETTAAG